MNTDVRKSSQKRPLTKRRKIVLAVLLLSVMLVTAEFVRSNTVIEVQQLTCQSEQLPEGFDGVKIVQVSDYHNHGGAYEDRLVEKIKEQQPDYIFITGDVADSQRTDVGKANSFLKKVSEITDCFLVWGNHEYSIDDYERELIALCCEKNGITVLENDFAVVERNGDKMLVVGTVNTVDETYDSMLEELPKDIDFTVWLHHYPEDVMYISNTSQQSGAQADLLFTGHAHGGLIRLPFVGGLYAPGQGFFPEYTSGKYSCDGTEMIVSRGTGNSGYSKRFLDPFHLVVCTLEKSR